MRNTSHFWSLLILEGAFVGMLLSRVQQVLQAVERRGPRSGNAGRRPRSIGTRLFQSPRVACAAGAAGSPHAAPPSQRIAQLGNLIDVLNSRRNQLFMPLAYLLAVGYAMRLRFREMAGRLRQGGRFTGSTSSASSRRLFTGVVLLRESRRSFPGDRDRRPLLRRRRSGPSAVAEVRAQRSAPDRRIARFDRQRIEYVR